MNATTSSTPPTGSSLAVTPRAVAPPPPSGDARPTSTAPPADQPLDVIGGGQAGLALGHHLQRRRARFLLLDAGPEIGHSWRDRWDSLRLFTPARYDSLPGMPFPAPADTHPGKDQVADHLAAYARHLALPVRLDARVLRLHQELEGGFAVTTPTEILRARQVVVATGPFQTPHIPAVAVQLDPLVPQLHSAGYRNPAQLPARGRVLVVGAANSGLQIAAELAATRAVAVAVGARQPRLPQRFLGRDLFFWLTRTGVMGKPADSRLTRRMRARGDVVVGSGIRGLHRLGVDVRPRLVGFAGRTARFADGSGADVDAVVWATGYRPDHSWLHIPDVVVDGQVRHDAGVTAVPGLYFLGLPWQTTRGSALLGFVGADAAALDTSEPSPGGDASPTRVFLTRYAVTLTGLLLGLAVVLLAWTLVSATPWAVGHPWPVAVTATTGWALAVVAWLRRRGWRVAAAHAVAWVAPVALVTPLAGSGWLPPAGLVLWAPITTVLAAALVLTAQPMAAPHAGTSADAVDV